MEWNIVIGAACAVGGLLISYAVFTRGREKEREDEGREAGTVLAELGYIKGGIDDLKADNREQRKTNTEVITRLTAVESSAKQAHKRIDRLEAVGKEE